jgi:hypothetical protein
MDAKAEQEQIKETQEKPEIKQEKAPNKKSLAWTKERKEIQRIKMIRLQAAGKAYKGKVKPPANEIIEPPISTTAPAGHSISYSITMSFIFILAVASIIIFFLKTGSLKQEPEN